jgi:hypothetical protein
MLSDGATGVVAGLNAAASVFPVEVKSNKQFKINTTRRMHAVHITERRGLRCP